MATKEGQDALFAACPEPDILIGNNAGPPFRDFRELDRQKMIDGVIGNMIVPVELLQRAIDPMIQKKFGRIVNITSGSVKMPIGGLDLSSGAPPRCGTGSCAGRGCAARAFRRTSFRRFSPARRCRFSRADWSRRVRAFPW